MTSKSKMGGVDECQATGHRQQATADNTKLGWQSVRAAPKIAPDTSMIHKAKDLSPEQKTAVESLLGRTIAPDEAISIQAIRSVTAPEWLQKSWQSAEQQGLDQLSADEIDAEIVAARKARRG